MTSTGFVPAGYRRRALPGGGSLLVHHRSSVVGWWLIAAALCFAAATLLTGAYGLPPLEVIQVLVGGGSPTDRFIVLDQRLPRALAALLVGATLGGSGALFQSIARNPLASPDVVGFTTGAATGGLMAILLAGAVTAGLTLTGTVVGGAVTALLVVGFALRRGLSGDRLILSGIAVAAMLGAVNDYLLSRTTIEEAETARTWQHGSLNAITWQPVLPVALCLLVFIPATLALTRRVRALELGDDAAAGTGVPILATRLVAFAVGVALAAVAVSAVGPIGFLALAAPQLARRLARSPGFAPLPSMAMGACILAGADLVAQRLLSPFQIPVGLVTAAFGGAYLIWMLLFADARHHPGGHP